MSKLKIRGFAELTRSISANDSHFCTHGKRNQFSDWVLLRSIFWELALGLFLLFLEMPLNSHSIYRSWCHFHQERNRAIWSRKSSSPNRHECIHPTMRKNCPSADPRLIPSACQLSLSAQKRSPRGSRQTLISDDLGTPHAKLCQPFVSKQKTSQFE